MFKTAASKAFGGGARGAAFGILGGFVLGAVGNVFADGLSTIDVVYWKDRRGTTKKFADIDVLESFDIYKDLLALHSARECDMEAFNDACRHIQSVVYLYKRFVDRGEDSVSMMDSRKITNYSIMATKSMNALLISCRAKNYPESSDVEKSMMQIHLTFEEIINGVRHVSKDILPEI
ncbi:EsV-1-43 [Ectocarpus siliculosus]|uniref:EsV-1-43 n=1 Tax=Ectocarpus siliculosus TaxID=2880 RepID=D8LP76_ECTSI|nr:EsV-1-43 [Ectocarpus siliculosus]|eukprot:CBN80347.1 EsV-1-43 [Ectocarpus siliculosus]